MDTTGLLFQKPKDNAKKTEKKIYRMKNRSSKRSKATDIPAKVKKIVYERDNGLCVICGKSGVPNSHYIKRSKGGLGIPENIVTMCIECHNEYDNGLNKERVKLIQAKVKSYLKRQYGTSWNEDNLIYKKWR